MFNQNHNMWSTITPLVPQSMAYNNNPLFLPSNQQNLNHLYYNQNHNFGQHLNQLNNNYNYFRPQLLQPSNQAINTSYVSQPNQSFHSKPIQTYSSTLQSMPTNESMVNPNQLNADVLEDNKWLSLLNPTQRQALDQLSKEQEEFELQFKNWEKDFDNWKQLNQTHPDRNAYHLYVNQWQEWRQRLVDRKHQMKRLRETTLHQLYSQVKQVSTHSHPNPPPPPPPPEERPPLPPNPPKDKPIPPPPPPTEPKPSPSREERNASNTSSFLSPQKILEIHKNLNQNEKQLNVNLEEFKDNKSGENVVNSSDNLESNTKTTDIEVIEIDCETKDNKNNFESNNETNTDTNAISKVAEDILFIQKQQELLKTLENIKKINSKDFSDNEIQVIDESKDFNIKDIVLKMKAIRPPEHPMQTNQLLSELPSLQGIVFNKRPNLETNLDNIRQQFGSNNNRLYEQHLREPYRQRFPNNPNPLSAADYRIQSNRHPFPIQSQPQRQRFPIETMNTRPPIPSHPIDNNHDFPQQNSFNDNQWTNSSPNPRERDLYYRKNDTVSTQLSTNTNIKYLAQTIDYNHKHENRRDFDSREESSVETHLHYSRKPMETFAKNLNFNNKINKNCNYFQSENRSDNRSQTEKPFISPQKVMPVMEESISYTDLRFFTQPKSGIVHIDDLLSPPVRNYRPENIVIIFRGLPGSGKSYIAKLIKEKEVEMNGSAPRILSIDDYFMAETERQTKDTETGKTITIKEFIYEYEEEMESTYRASLLKTYKRTIDDRLFPFIIVDAINEMVINVEEFYNYGLKNGFTVYVIEMDSIDPIVCHKNNIHKRNLDEIKQIIKKWQKLPKFMLKLDIKSLLQNISIKNMEIQTNDTKINENIKRKSDFESESSKRASNSSSHFEDDFEDTFNTQSSLSRWERMEASEAKLDKLDSFKLKTKSQTIDEYLEVTEDYEQRGQKRVRWADIEEKKKQDRMRDMGYVVGQDWHQLMDPQHCERALTQTKYF